MGKKQIGQHTKAQRISKTALDSNLDTKNMFKTSTEGSTHVTTDYTNSG